MADKKTKKPAAQQAQQPNIRGRPTSEQIAAEIRRDENKHRFRRFVRSAAYAILIVAALAVLVSTFFLPVMKVYGRSMEPAVAENEIVVCVKQRQYRPGDIVALYFNNRIILRRVICVGGDQFDIDEAGNVFVNGEYYDEPYLIEKSYETTDIDLPFKVNEANYFIMADNRSFALDSRSIAVGTVTKEQIAGKVILSIWPFRTFRMIG